MIDYVLALERESEAFVRELDGDVLVGSVIRGDAGIEDYVRFLVASYHYVRLSGFLLAKTAEELRRRVRCPRLRAVIDTKASEEGQHDRWLLCDLRSCGVNVELVKGSAVPSAVQAYVNWSLAFAQAGSPAFLGAAYTLEFISMRRAKQAAENLRARSGIPNIDRAVRFLEGHGVADHGHIAELAEVLEHVEGEQDRSHVSFSAAVTRRLYPLFFADVTE